MRDAQAALLRPITERLLETLEYGLRPKRQPINLSIKP